jgi:transcription antitermination factor NusG
MFVAKKHSGDTKAWLVVGGNKQRDYLTKEDSSSPTVATKSVLLTYIVDAAEKRDVAIVNIPNAFIQTWVENKKDRVIIRIWGVLVKWVTKTDPEVYSKYVTVDKKGDKVLLVECLNAIYVTMVAGLLYYRKFADSLGQKMFIKNPYDPCVWNKIIDGKQCTICFHVDDCKISHVKSSVNNSIIAWLRQEYESIFTDGSGKMKVARGRVHVYVGITLDFTVDKVVKVTMIPYVDEIIGAWDKACEDSQDGFQQVKRQRILTAAPEDLFKVDDDASKLCSVVAKDFHSIIMMILYVTKQARPDTLLAVAFLSTRV